MRYRRVGAAVATVAVGGLALVAVPAGATTDDRVDGRANSGPAIEWGECPAFEGPTAKAEQADTLECGTLDVPMDYTKPNGKTIELAVSRLRSANPEKRRGVLLLNPGGPGGEGLDMPLSIANVAPPASLLESYDLIGFDPRGIGHSTPVTCGLTPAQQSATFPSYPHGPADVAKRANQLSQITQQCAENGGDVLPYVTTPNTARDMDQIRIALGEQKVSYFGISYGSYLGTVYAELFPGRTDRFILDSAVGPHLVWRDEFRAWGKATERRFPDFAEWAAARDQAYELGNTPKAVRDKYFELAERLDEQPTGGMDGTAFRQTTRSLLYDDTAFAQLAQLWQGLDRSDADAVRAAIREAGLAQVPDDNGVAALMAVLCGDTTWPRSLADYQRDVELDRKRYPMIGAMAANMFPCARWPIEPKEEPVEITDNGPSNILIVQNLRDPATIYDGAVDLRASFGERARLVTVDQGDHGVYLYTENACATNVATAFLVDGEFPERDQFCAADEGSPAYEKAAAPEREEFLRDIVRRSMPLQPVITR